MASRMKSILLPTFHVIIISILIAEAADDENRITSTADINEGVAPHQSKMINDFGYKMMVTMMEQNTNDNIIISPASVFGLLAMALLGSAGNTHQELATQLGFSKDILSNREQHHAFGELLHQLNDDGKTSKTLYADALFVDTQTQLRDEYRNFLYDVYRGEALSVDFRQKEHAKQVINEWIKNHTEGNIENFLKESLPESTKVVLSSALYFNGQWEHPFVPEYTLKMPFKKPNNTIMVDLMLNLGQFEYISSEREGVDMIALPYNDSVTTLYALKPRMPRKQHLLELMQRLDYNKIDELINQMSSRKAVIRFPKMELQSNIQLEEALKKMGINSIFHPADAHFGLMVKSDEILKEIDESFDKLKVNQTAESLTIQEMLLNSIPNPGVYVDSIIHDVKLNINEYGTEAVAATTGVLARSAEQFYADSPFYMFIRNEKTKAITFSAVIFDPTK